MWRSLKYECVYLHACEAVSEAKAGVRKWVEFYNHKRPHSALGGQPPAVVYWQRTETTNPDQQVKEKLNLCQILNKKWRVSQLASLKNNFMLYYWPILK